MLGTQAATPFRQNPTPKRHITLEEVFQNVHSCNATSSLKNFVLGPISEVGLELDDAIGNIDGTFSTV